MVVGRSTGNRRHFWRRVAFGWAIGCALLAAPRVVWADVQAELDKGRAAYVAKNLGEAEQHFRKVLDPQETGRDSAQTSLARMYLGAIAVAQRNREAAAGLFETLLLDDQLYEPDPLTFPTEVINLFIDTRGQLRAKLNAASAERARLDAERKAREEADRKAREAWLLRVQELATEERITVRSSRLFALVPFGAGQFQNGQTGLGAIFLGVESALVLGTMITLPLYLSAQSSKEDELSRGDPDRIAQAYRDRAVTIRTANLTMVGALAFTGLVGIAQAQWSYVPERFEMKRRSLPPAPASGQKTAGSPWFFGVEGGAMGGLGGRF